MSEWKSTACVLCKCNCGIEVQLGGADGRRLVKVRGDDAHPASRGAPARAFLVGDSLTLADIVFSAELAPCSAERASRRVLSEAALMPLYGEELRETYPRALAHFARLCAHEAFAPDLGPYLARLDVQASGWAADP